MPKRALIIGILGQDGSYLADLLGDRGDEIHGAARSSDVALGRWLGERDLSSMTLHACDVTNTAEVERVVSQVEPDEIYHLAGMSSVAESFAAPAAALVSIGVGTTNVLEAAKKLNARKAVRCFLAGSAEVFAGDASTAPQTESTPLRPQNPYGAAKALCLMQTAIYRQAHGLFASMGILFNHESPRRPERFVSKKIARGAARVSLGLQDKLTVGNLEASRDWGYAKEYVEAMASALAVDAPADYIIATGETHTVGEFVERAFAHVGLDWRAHVEIDRGLFRPTDGNVYRGDATRARERLGWTARTSFQDLVGLMVEHELTLARDTRA